MKRFLYAIFAVSALVGCSKSEVEEIVCEPEQPAEPVLTYTEVGAVSGGDTRATFGADLEAYWQEDDQILTVQSLSTTDTYRTNFGESWLGGYTDVPASASAMPLKSGAGTAAARFGGEVGDYLDGAASYIHFAYPAAGTTLTTLTKVSNQPSGGVESRKTTTTCTFTAGAEQDGVWQPSLFASTSETVALNADLGEVRFTNLNSALGIRVFEQDGTTPKPVEYIKITATNNIVGTISATTPESPYGSPLSADMFAVNATGNTVTASQLWRVEPLGDNHEYRFEVLPVDAGEITIELIDEKGSSVVRRVTLGKPFAANCRHGVKVTWDTASITAGDATSWYEDYAGNSLTSYSRDEISVRDIRISGITAADITEAGVKVDGTNYPVQTDWSGMRNLVFSVAGIASGEHTVAPYAKLTDGTEITAAPQQVIVMSAGSMNSKIYSAYNERNNALHGSRIYADSSIDPYTDTNLVSRSTLYCAGTEAGQSASVNVESEELAWQQWDNCYVSVTLKNGYTFTSAATTVQVTGIPYSHRFHNSGEDLDGWYVGGSYAWKWDGLNLLPKKNADGYISKKFHLPEALTLNYHAEAKYYHGTAGSNKATIYVGPSAAQSAPNKDAGAGATSYSFQNAITLNADGNRAKWDNSIALSPDRPYMTVSHNNPAYYSFLSVTGYLGPYSISVTY